MSSDGEKVPCKDYYCRWQVGVSVRVVGMEMTDRITFQFFNIIINILTAPILHGEYKFFMAYIKTRAIVMTTISTQSCIIPL